MYRNLRRLIYEKQKNSRLALSTPKNCYYSVSRRYPRLSTRCCGGVHAADVGAPASLLSQFAKKGILSLLIYGDSFQNRYSLPTYLLRQPAK